MNYQRAFVQKSSFLSFFIPVLRVYLFIPESRYTNRARTCSQKRSQTNGLRAINVDHEWGMDWVVRGSPAVFDEKYFYTITLYTHCSGGAPRKFQFSVSFVGILLTCFVDGCTLFVFCLDIVLKFVVVYLHASMNVGGPRGNKMFTQRFPHRPEMNRIRCWVRSAGFTLAENSTIPAGIDRPTCALERV